jgi:hypothetical protein
VFLLLIASSPSIKALPPLPKCNSFPKIFGGSSGDSILRQIDVFNDYLAIGGDIWDDSLTGINSAIPYVVLQSISSGGKIYWAKVFSLKSLTIFGVQFSTDGALLIAHSYSFSCFIVVIDVSSGNVLSARSYSDGAYYNYNNLVKSMLVSSGASPMAYVLSNYYAGDSCTGQHLFNFNPRTFTSAAVWIK